MATPGEAYQLLLKMGDDPLQKRHTMGAFFTFKDHHRTYDFISPLQFDMDGRSVLITGASNGVGKATAISYAQAGCTNIAIAARSPLDGVVEEVQEAAKLAGRKPPKLVQLKVDITGQSNVERAAAEIEEKFGGLDILINNAGYMDKYVPILESDPEDWWKSWQVNVYGTYLMTRYFLPLLLNNSHRKPLKMILNVSTMWAHTRLPEATAYQSSKFAQLRLTELCSVNHPPSGCSGDSDGHDDGLICLTLHPGGLDTDFARPMTAAMREFLDDKPELPGDSIVWLTAEMIEWLRGRYVSAQWDFEELSGDERRQEIVRNDLLKMRMSVG